jgi:polyferredoxin
VKRGVLKLIFILFFRAFTIQSAFGEDDFKSIAPSDEFAAVESQVKTEAVSYNNNLLKIIIENNIHFLSLGILLGALAFFLKLKRARNVMLLASLVFFGFYAGGCNCSVGAFLKLFYNIFFDKTNLILLSLLIGIPILTTIFFGRIFCGYICPAGALQEFAAVRDRLIKIKPSVEKKLRYLRFVFFTLIILISILRNEFIFPHISPFKAIFNLSGNYIQIALALLILVLSLFIYRPFCRFLCPLSIVLELAGKFSIFKIEKDKIHCEKCKRCAAKCPVDAIDAAGNINNGLCIRCEECSSCIKK